MVQLCAQMSFFKTIAIHLHVSGIFHIRSRKVIEV